ncbi:MAG: anti-sigma F factor antagonist [Actinobacteria bacterium]|nr:anti-sigma F factor antagonist [Actinomycetota bacterium]
MDLQKEISKEVLLVRLSGEIDLAVTDTLRDSLDEELERDSPVKNIIVNLSGVTFIDSSGLGVMLGRYRKISKAGGKMFIVGASPQVRRILEISGLLNIMKECPDEERAMCLAE